MFAILQCCLELAGCDPVLGQVCDKDTEPERFAEPIEHASQIRRSFS